MRRLSWLATASSTVIAAALLAAQPAVADGMTYVKAKPAAKPAPMASLKDSASRPDARPHIGNWGGLYLGVNVGVSFQDIGANYNEYAADGPRIGHDETRGSLGGHVGIQHQMGRIVVGFEAGWRGNAPFGNEWSEQACFGIANYHCDARMNSVLTLGPRLGLAHDRYLLFVTGGWAWGTIQTREFDGTAGTENFRWSQRHDGWFLGGGIEMMLTDRWVLGLEYQHVHLSGEAHWVPIVPWDSRHVSADEDIIRVRLSYKLGRAAPAAAPLK